ncbi:LacI family DNA-binding transcriptional regulator [Humibacter sp. RRB41]|uniref:LacI family DNA-binding transcriptional regulator n=1 Tax=Humibacter sp. RRB41 TaxID=2919946 RepID=UPI001FAA8D2F|nr:LacI family DNA-binding transcriptional regulator [Humibacter sp. RRB41]
MGDDARIGRSAGVRDVAALAGVSPQTVSRVINEHPSVRDETRQRVQDAMRSLGYRVNNAARTLGTRRTHTLGVIASNAALFGPSVGVVALESAARAVGRWVTTAYADAADEASIEASLDHLLAQGVDGVIVVAPRLDSVSSLARRHPTLNVGALPSAEGARAQAHGAGLAVGHLLELGHRRIARVGGPGDWLEEVARERGFMDALRVAGPERVAASPVAHWSGDWSAASGAALASEIAAVVRTGVGPTAVVVANDQMALGLISGLAAEGIRVPEDVSIVGFDDNTDAEYYRPALTTVRIDTDGEARRSVAEVLGLEATGGVAPPRLVVRGSTSRVR